MGGALHLMDKAPRDFPWLFARSMSHFNITGQTKPVWKRVLIKGEKIEDLRDLDLRLACALTVEE